WSCARKGAREMDDLILRQHLVELLQGGHAHISAEKALAEVKPKLRNVRPAAGLHSVWEELEHLRLAQEDILRYTLDAAWRSPAWPEGYWPADPESMTEEAWSKSISGFFADLGEIINLVQDANLDLTARIPPGE